MCRKVFISTLHSGLSNKRRAAWLAGTGVAKVMLDGFQYSSFCISRYSSFSGRNDGEPHGACYLAWLGFIVRRSTLKQRREQSYWTCIVLHVTMVIEADGRKAGERQRERVREREPLSIESVLGRTYMNTHKE